MGVLATASLLALGVLSVRSVQVTDYPPVTKEYVNYLPLQFYNPQINPVDNAAHSAQVAQNFESPYNYEFSPPQPLRFEPADAIPNSRSIDSSYSPNTYNINHQEYHDGSSEDVGSETGYRNFVEHDHDNDDLDGYTHYKTSKNTNREGPYQIETIETKSYHKKVPHFDTSSFQEVPYAHKKHGEVHYHQHDHVHEHDHIQEHKHHHKQEHKHSHDEHHKHGHNHKQEHKHSHHEDHKHAHEHEQKHSHDHHSEHKHNHKHVQDHKHSHQEKHHHGHDHKHHQDHKHDHHHGHKHEHGHKHGHDHGHKHSHHNSHKHGHDHQHKHDQHHDHKHGHKHEHKHGHHHGHKHGHNHGHKHEHSKH